MASTQTRHAPNQSCSRTGFQRNLKVNWKTIEACSWFTLLNKQFAWCKKTWFLTESRFNNLSEVTFKSPGIVKSVKKATIGIMTNNHQTNIDNTETHPQTFYYWEKDPKILHCQDFFLKYLKHLWSYIKPCKYFQLQLCYVCCVMLSADQLLRVLAYFTHSEGAYEASIYH